MTKDSLTIAWHEMKRRHFASAIQLLESRSDIYEENFEYYLLLGIACLYAGDIGSASSYFQKARKIKLVDTRLLLGQAAIFLRRGETNRALQYYLEVKDNEPGNKTAIEAIEFIRTHGDYDKICRWVDTGRIEQFYPQLGVNPDKVSAIVLPLFACLVGCFVALFIFPAKPKINQSRADLSQLELTSEEKNSAKEKDLTTQSFRYVLTNKEINKKYNNALQYFQENRDNAAQVEVNYILNSDALLSIKQKAQVLATYFEVPNFNTITDVPTFSEVKNNPYLYLDCWVDWGGKISNANTYSDNSFSCDLLVGDDSLLHYEGSVNVKFDAVPSIIGEQSARILGKISMEDGSIFLKGRAVYQSVYDK